MGETVLVSGGRSGAIVMTAKDADERTAAAARVLAEYVRKSTGVELPVYIGGDVADHDHDTGDVIPIRIGIRGEEGGPLEPLLRDLDEDGFVIRTANGEIDIAGPSSWGTMYGVYEFLERYVGVRWLLPGEFGEDVPVYSDLSVPEETVREQPAFLSRDMNDFPAAADWMRFNRLRRRMNPFHNLCNLLPPSRYKDTHPEFYKAGAKLDRDTDWQPAFTNRGTAEEAIRNICSFFEANPDEACYSIGVNDNGGFVEDDPDHPDYPNRLNSIGHTDMSDIYFRWVKQVAEGVLAKFPDKYIGLYAYADVYDPPTGIELPANVVVYITDDRMSWRDPEMGEAGRRLTETWNKVTPSLGFYEYMYGSPYMVPRMYLQHIAGTYRYALRHGVIAHFVEMFANFGGEGAKPWVVAKLQWNPERDVEELLEEWYERAVGKKAAAHLSAYYKLWERFWEERAMKSDWYERWKGAKLRTNYMAFYEPSYLAIVTPQDIADSRRLLEAAVADAETELQRKRAAFLLDTFVYYEASALSYPKGRVPAAIDEKTALELLTAVADGAAGRDRRLALIDRFAKNPLQQLTVDPFTWKLEWSGVNPAQLYALLDRCKTGETSAVIRKVRELEKESLSPSVKPLMNLIRSLLSEEGNGSAAEGEWILKTADSSASTGLVRSPDVTPVSSPTGRGVVLSGIGTAWMAEELPFAPGTYGVAVHYKARIDAALTAMIQLQFKLYDAEDRPVAFFRSEDRVFVRSTAGEWATLHFIADIPAQAKGVPVSRVEILTYLKEFAVNDRIELVRGGTFLLGR